MLPLASTTWAPKARKNAPTVSTESLVSPRPMPNGTPALWQDSAAFRKGSVVQLSALGGLPAGYISLASIPACFFKRSIREQGPLIWLPIQVGTPSHLSPALPRYSTVPLTAPFCLMSGSTTSFIGSSKSACACGHHVAIARISCPDFAWASAAIVISFFLPLLVM